MSKDLVLLGTAVGLLADAVKLIINYILYLFNLTNVVFWQITASRFLAGDDLFKPVTYFVGGVADVTVTAALGIIFVYFIYFTGRDYLWVKSVGFGLVVWVGLFGTLLGQSVQAKIPQGPSGIIVTIIAHVVFGLGLAAFTALLYPLRENEIRKSEGANHRIIPAPAKKIIASEDKKGNIRSRRKIRFRKPGS